MADVKKPEPPLRPAAPVKVYDRAPTLQKTLTAK
jgi:hypothetical protein